MITPLSTESSPPIQQSAPYPVKPPARFRWWPALFVLGSGGLVQQILWWTFEPDRTVQIFSVMGVAFGTVVGLLIWWLFFSRARWRTRLLVTAGVGLAAIGFCTIAIRLEGFTGEMIPRLAWRWSKTSEERAEEFRKSASLLKPALAPAKGDQNETDATHQPLVVTDEDWPRYRGPNLDGKVLNSEIRRDWQTHPPELLWKHPVGPAWSSFAIVDGLAFTQEQRLQDEAVVCYDAKTGDELWVHTDPVRFVHAVGGDGPRATPTIQEGLLYALGGTGYLNCLDPRTGREIWSHDILSETNAKNAEYGMAGSPLVYENLVIVNPGGPNGQAVVAYNRLTGDKVWSAGNDVASYASPQLSTVQGERQLLIFDAVGLAGHDPATGTQLWKFPWTNGPKVNAAQPIVLDELGDNLVFVGNGYTIGCAVVRVSNENDNWTVTPVWETKKLKLKFNCAIERNGYIYGLDEGILCCFQAEGLKQLWKGGRFGYGELLLIGDVILVQAELGEVVLVEANPKSFREITRFTALGTKTWNHPVLCRGRLYVRNGEEAACYDVSASSAEKRAAR